MWGWCPWSGRAWRMREGTTRVHKETWMGDECARLFNVSWVVSCVNSDTRQETGPWKYLGSRGMRLLLGILPAELTAPAGRQGMQQDWASLCSHTDWSTVSRPSWLSYTTTVASHASDLTGMGWCRSKTMAIKKKNKTKNTSLPLPGLLYWCLLVTRNMQKHPDSASPLCVLAESFLLTLRCLPLPKFGCQEAQATRCVVLVLRRAGHHPPHSRN